MAYWGTEHFENGYGIDAATQTKAFLVKEIEEWLAVRELDAVAVDTAMGFIEILRMILAVSSAAPDNLNRGAFQRWHGLISGALDRLSRLVPPSEGDAFVNGRRAAVEATFRSLAEVERLWQESGTGPDST